LGRAPGVRTRNGQVALRSGRGREVYDPGADEKSVPPAERPPGSEEELARGRVEQTPVTVINWVAVVIGALVALALAVVVVAYVIA